MATGFAEVQRNNIKKNKGTRTIFERITEATEGESKSYDWYRGKVASIASEYRKDPSKVLREQAGDPEPGGDGNVLRRYPVEGHLYMFEYEAISKYLPYYDTFPLVYVVKVLPGKEFVGANLHYMNPKKRIKAVQNLMKGKVDMPKICFHKYLDKHVEGYMLDLHIDEWDTAILLPVENFVTRVRGFKFPYKKEDVWQETNEKFYDKIKGTRMIDGYGNRKSKEMVK